MTNKLHFINTLCKLQQLVHFQFYFLLNFCTIIHWIDKIWFQDKSCENNKNTTGYLFPTVPSHRHHFQFPFVRLFSPKFSELTQMICHLDIADIESHRLYKPYLGRSIVVLVLQLCLFSIRSNELRWNFKIIPFKIRLWLQRYLFFFLNIHQPNQSANTLCGCPHMKRFRSIRSCQNLIFHSSDKFYLISSWNMKEKKIGNIFVHKHFNGKHTFLFNRCIVCILRT